MHWSYNLKSYTKLLVSFFVTNPQKHSIRFDAFGDRVLPAIQEKILVSMPHLACARAVDNNGYFPTHNQKFAQPLTGKYDTDLVNGRIKRIFIDGTGARCGANTKSCLLQTYQRDTGEVKRDLSVPDFVTGKHWSGFHIGYRSNTSINETKNSMLALVATLVAVKSGHGAVQRGNAGKPFA